MARPDSSELSRRWMLVAHASWKAAKLLSDQNMPKDAVSRAYYAGYQAMTGLLHFSGQVHPPVVDGERRESWAHRDTPRMVQSNLKGLITEDQQRARLASSLSQLYKLRVMADYVSAEQIEVEAAVQACRDAGRLRKVAQIVTGYSEPQK